MPKKIKNSFVRQRLYKNGYKLYQGNKQILEYTGDAYRMRIPSDGIMIKTFLMTGINLCDERRVVRIEDYSDLQIKDAVRQCCTYQGNNRS